MTNLSTEQCFDACPCRSWQPIDTAPEGVVVRTAIIEREQRNTADLIRKGRLWFFPDMSMYVYYQPTHWRPA